MSSSVCISKSDQSEPIDLLSTGVLPSIATNSTVVPVHEQFTRRPGSNSKGLKEEPPAVNESDQAVIRVPKNPLKDVLRLLHETTEVAIKSGERDSSVVGFLSVPKPALNLTELLEVLAKVQDATDPFYDNCYNGSPASIQIKAQAHTLLSLVEGFRSSALAMSNEGRVPESNRLEFVQMASAFNLQVAEMELGIDAATTEYIQTHIDQIDPAKREKLESSLKTRHKPR